MFRILFDIGIRHILGRKRQTLTTMLAVSVSTTVLITTISLTRGLLDSFTETIIDVAPHISLKGETLDPIPTNLFGLDKAGKAAFVKDNIGRDEPEEVRNYGQILDIAVSPVFSGKIVAASPFVESQIMAVKGNRNQPVLLKGVMIDREDRISHIGRSLTSGDLVQFKNTPDALLVGRTVAEDLDVRLDDQITIISPDGTSRQCKVAGIFFTGVNAVDNTIMASLKLGQTVEGLSPNKVTGISFKVRDPFANASVAEELERMTGYRCLTWQEENASVLALFRRIGVIVLSLVGFVGVVSGFGVANILVTTVFEKSRDIAIMKSFGFSSLQMIGLFVFEGFLVGLGGALAGGVLATGSIAFLASLHVQSSQGPLTKSGFSMSWNPWYFFFVILVTVLISTIAAALPSIKAAKLEPVKVLRESNL
ncbi:MAG TPA: ABC transporter permease [Chlorobaculum parvum]|uniref:ABC transporter permease n=1 Tax=Chlorobaculum parvum TaxID=274539 RepID=A0A7C5HKC3_9CHLB|nr:ABC transporter permease [Chlorobaculum parvum]